MPSSQLAQEATAPHISVDSAPVREASIGTAVDKASFVSPFSAEFKCPPAESTSSLKSKLWKTASLLAAVPVAAVAVPAAAAAAVGAVGEWSCGSVEQC